MGMKLYRKTAGGAVAVPLADAQAASGRLRARNLLRAGRNVNVALIGDSTGNENTEWFYLLGQAIGAAYPSLRVTHRLWNDSTQLYDAATTVQEPSLAPVLAFEDLFTTDSAATFGRKPDRSDGAVGNQWSRDGVAADGDWTVSGGKLVRSSDTTVSTILCGGSALGDQTLTQTGVTISTVGDGAGTQIHRSVIHYIDPNNFLIGDVRVSSAGVVTWYLIKRIAGVNTTIASLTPVPAMPNATAGQTGTLTLAKSGLNLTMTWGASTLTGALLQSDSDALASSTQAGLVGGSGNMIGMTIDAVRLTVQPSPQTLTLYNASMPGSTLAYHTAGRLAIMLPVAMDAIYISSSHNYGLMDGLAYLNTVQSFVAGLPAAQTNAAVMLSSQNPQKAPALYPLQHADRCRVLATLSSFSRCGYVPVAEAFSALWDGGASLVNADGIHPMAGGSAVWASAAYAQWQ